MYLLAHAMAGILIGLLLAFIADDRRAVALAALGAVLPDLVDKPLGHFILARSVGYGRIYFHGLTVFFLFVVAGLLIYHHRHRIGLLAVAAGMASHQVLDGMWHHPVEWFWPFLGPIPHYYDYSENVLWDAIRRELTQPSEWILFILIAGLFAVFYRRELAAALTRLANFRNHQVLFAALVLAVLAVAARLLL